MGILVLLREVLSKMQLPLEDFFRSVLDGYRVISADKNSPDLEKRMSQFVLDRLVQILREDGLSHDLLQAILASDEDDPIQFETKARALEGWVKKSESERPRTALLRALRILPQEEKEGEKEPQGVQKDLLKEKAEQGLFEAIESCHGAIQDATKGRQYEKAWTALEPLEGPIDHFFDDVMVMDKDLQMRNNRLALLKKIRDLVQPLGDLRQLSGKP